MGIFSFGGRTDGVGFLLASLSTFAALALWAIVGAALAAFLGDSGPGGRVGVLIIGWGLIITLPLAIWVYLAGMARRLHDIGASAWWLLLCLPLLPLAGWILLLAPSQKEENRFGA